MAEMSPGVAMFFAPWATTAFMSSGQSWQVTVSILLSGAAAGLIYAAFAKRG